MKRLFLALLLLSATTLPAAAASNQQQFQIMPPPIPMMRMSSDKAELTSDLFFATAKAGDFEVSGAGYNGVLNVVASDHAGASFNLALGGVGGEFPESFGVDGTIGIFLMNFGGNLVLDLMGKPGQNEKGWTLPVAVGPNFYMASGSISTGIGDATFLATMAGWQFGAGIGIPLDKNNGLRLFPFYVSNQMLGGTLTVTAAGFSQSFDIEGTSANTTQGFDLQFPKIGLSLGTVLQEFKKSQPDDENVKTKIYRLSWTHRWSGRTPTQAPAATPEPAPQQ